MRFEGLSISGGVSVGSVCLFNDWRHSDLPEYVVAGDGIARERERLERAIREASEHFARLVEQVTGRIGAAQAAIFAAQKMMVEDEYLHAEMFGRMEQTGLNAEAIVAASLEAYESVLSQMGPDYLRERSSDIAEVKRRLLNVLGDITPSLECVGGTSCERGRNRIVVAEELTPTLTMSLDSAHVLGFVTEHGGTASHAAILARALGVPAVSGIQGIHNLVPCGTELLIDGDHGVVIAWPREATLDAYPSARHSVVYVEAAEPIPELRVMANINRPAEVEQVIAMRAEGIGLYRTEFAFIAADRVLSEDEQFEQYAAVVCAMDGLPVTFRLLDVGGDKAGAFLDLPHEENPQLGLRGARLLLAHPELLAAQARALARASRHGAIDILYPMIADLEQFVALRKLFFAATEGLECGVIRHGVMFEVPAACICARAIFAEAEFGSIGTNDLIQYLFAVDRDNELVAGEYNPDRPAFWALVESVVRAAEETGRPLSVCGEMAGDPQYVAPFVRRGLTTLSVSSRLIPEVRHAAAHRLQME